MEEKPVDRLSDSPQVAGGQPAEPKMSQSPPPPTTQTGTKQGETGLLAATPPQATTPPSPPPPTTQPTPQRQTITIELPPGVERTPTAEIDVWIRKEYTNRENLEAIMKESHRRAYRREVQQRVDPFEARHPPFDDIPPGTVLGGGEPVAGGISPETQVIPATTPPAIVQSAASNLPPATNLPAEFAAAYKMSDE